MPLKFQRNLYPGINAHLQSEVLAAGRWLGYHNHIITALEASLNRHLPPGYIAVSEESIQMRRPDIHIEATGESRHPPHHDLPAPFQPDTRVEEHIPEALLIQTEEEIEKPIGIGIYVERDHPDMPPLIWIEVLSPSNKAGESLGKYIEKRREVLYRGTTFVEIDLIPGISTSLPAIPDYDTPGDETEHHPYHIWFINPVVTRDEPGFFAHAAFTVSDTIPDIRLRLLDRDSVLMKLGEAYESMFATNPGWGRQTDYAIPPVHVENYVQFRDQVWIAGLMKTIAQQVEHGQDLNDPTLPKPIPGSELLTTLYQNPTQVTRILALP